jgi:hypothetical protein
MIMQKGMEMSLIVGMILALIGVSLFIVLANGDVRNAATSMYCKAFVKFSSNDQGASIPEMCLGQKQYDVETINSTQNKIASRQLLSYLIACFQKSDSLSIKEKYTCFEIHLPRNIENVTEDSVSEILNKEDHCRSIENSDYGCGALNQIDWAVVGESISGQTILFIEYDPSKDLVRVIG